MNTRKPAVHTIESLLDRCTEEGECFMWTGYSTNSCPLVHHKGSMKAVRRVMLELQGKQITGKYVAASCGNALCCNPGHIIQRSQDAHAKRMAKKAHTGVGKQNHLIGVRTWRRANPLKLTEEAAAAIRSDSRNKFAVAADYGINASMVSKIRNGSLWRDYTNPFAALF